MTERTELTDSRVDATNQSLVVFSLEDRRYALPLASVQRSMRVVAITPVPEAPAIMWAS